MDVNGTKFHLIYGEADWGGLRLDGRPDTPLAELWADPDVRDLPVEWNTAEQSLRLRRLTFLFKSRRTTNPLDPDQRRGADRDRYGHWYWIGADERSIRFLAQGERASVLFWNPESEDADCEVSEVDGFFSDTPPTPTRLRLRGLAVTTLHYLVVGFVSQSDPTQRGLLVFDLHRGGPAMMLLWPQATPFDPWDMAAAPDGGVLVLDRQHRRYWRLTRHFQVAAQITETEAYFQPEDGEPLQIAHRTTQADGVALADSSAVGERSPLSIETGPDDHVLILYSHDDPAVPSQIWEYDGDAVVAEYSLEDSVKVVDPYTQEEQLFSISAHDIAYVADRMGEGDAASVRHLLFVGERYGNQAIAFVMERGETPADHGLRALPDYLPLRRWEAKGLVAAGRAVYYDFADRWLALQVFSEHRYSLEAAITTPETFVSNADGIIPGQPFDSNLIGCVWHRVFLDADIPVGTSVSVQARAADDVTLLPASPWIDQPKPYLRSGGAELPFHDPWALQRKVIRAHPDAGAPSDSLDAALPTSLQCDDLVLSERAGTWELLLQGVRGRFIQLRLVLKGSGRSTPELYALRVWYPRFTYLQYLPALYSSDLVHADFLDRWLANFEGFFTHLEDKIEHAARLFDPRTAPAEALDWLARWMGLVLDPIWEEARRRFFIRHANQLYSRRGTLPGLEIALRLYLDPISGLTPRLFDPRCWGRSRVRIIEWFQTRDLGGLALGDTSDTDGTAAGRTPEQAAHRFSVLLPYTLTEAQQLMVERIVEIEKPAHTAFDIKYYWDAFRVGEARLGLDTRLGESSREFRAMILGDAVLPYGFLGLPYPNDIDDRLILDRDRLGDLPPL